MEQFKQTLDKRLEQLLEEVPEVRGEHDLSKAQAREFAKDRAFVLWCLQYLPECSNADLRDLLDSIVDGGDEKGIDAVYVPEKGQRLLVLQAKRYRSPKRKGVSKNELIKLLNGVGWLLEGDLSKVENAQFRARAEDFREAFQSFEYEGVKVVFACTARRGVAREARDEIEHWCRRFGESGNRFEVEVLVLEDLKRLYISQVHQPFRLKVEIDLVGKPYVYEARGARALVGTVRGLDLARLFDEHRHRILAANIRNYLGNVKINKGIRATASDPSEAENFWFYNNGVTFVCDEFSFRSLEDARVKLENAQVINGAQTITSLWQIWRKDKDNEGLRRAQVLVKIIEKEGDIDFRRRVTLFANSQNAVRPYDLVGTDTIQIELKRKLLQEGYYYETRRGDYRAEREELKEKGVEIKDVFSLKFAAQALATCFEQIPAIAKSQTSKLFLTEEEGGHYDKLFWPAIDPLHVLVSVAVLKKVSAIRKLLSSSAVEAGEWLPEGYAEPPIWLPHADYSLAALFFHRCFDQSRRDDLGYLRWFRNLVETDEAGSFRETYKYLVGWIDKRVKTREGEYGFSYPKFFKNQSEYNGLRKEMSTACSSPEQLGQMG